MYIISLLGQNSYQRYCHKCNLIRSYMILSLNHMHFFIEVFKVLKRKWGKKSVRYLPLKITVMSPEVWERNCYKHCVHFLLRVALLWEKRWYIEKALFGTGWMGTSGLSPVFTLGFNFVRLKKKVSVERKHCPLWLRWVVRRWAGGRQHGAAWCCPWGERDPTKPPVLAFFSYACRIPLWHLKWRIAFCKFSTDELAGILEVFPRQAS